MVFIAFEQPFVLINMIFVQKKTHFRMIQASKKESHLRPGSLFMFITKTACRENLAVL
jgi:hypothetical protein